MKKCKLSLLLCISILVCSIFSFNSFADVYIPNSDEVIEEIVTDSEPGAEILSKNTLSFTTSPLAKSGQWKKDSIGWWWQYSDGSYAKNKWEYINNYWYYFNNDGYMIVGWRYINSKWYFLNDGTSYLPICFAAWLNVYAYCLHIR